MLLTDTYQVTAAQLREIDATVDSAVRSTTTPSGAGASLDAIIRLAWDEVKNVMMGRLTSLFDNQNSFGYYTFGATIYNGFRVHPAQIVVSDYYSSQMLAWLKYHALFMLFRSASKTSDINSDRRDLYEKYANSAKGEVMRAGCPIVTFPIPAPAAVKIPNSGLWTATAASGGTSVAPGSVTVAITYVSNEITINNESGPAPSQTIALLAGQRVSIDTSVLIAPDGKLGGQYKVAPAASHWNVYAQSAGGMRLVNSSPITVATSSFVFDPLTVSPGAILGDGQMPDRIEYFMLLR